MMAAILFDALDYGPTKRDVVVEFQDSTQRSFNAVELAPFGAR